MVNKNDYKWFTVIMDLPLKLLCITVFMPMSPIFYKRSWRYSNTRNISWLLATEGSMSFLPRDAHA